jgi:hypothetical protein
MTNNSSDQQGVKCDADDKREIFEVHLCITQ